MYNVYRGHKLTYFCPVDQEMDYNAVEELFVAPGRVMYIWVTR